MTTTDADLVLAGDFEPASRARWMELVAGVLGKGTDDRSPEAIAALFERRLVTRTLDGLAVQPLYTATDVSGGGVAAVTFTRRGGEAWDIRVRVDGEGDGGKAVDELAGGATSVWVDLRAAAGTDVDVLDRALDGVFLDLAPVVLDAGGGAEAAAGALMELWDRRGVAPDVAAGGFGADPLGGHARTGGAEPLEPALAAAARLARRAAATYPGVRAVVVDSTVYHEAGGSAAFELGCSLATAVTYLRALTGAGLSVDEACGQLEFRLAATADQFTTIALLRAARRGWARVVEVSGGSERSRVQRQHAVTSTAMTTRYDSWNNLLRTTLAGFAAGVGGADSVTVLPHDALSVPGGSELGRRLARNVSHVLMDESHLARVADPGGGSWYVERLTDDVAAAGWAWFTEIEAAGGMAAALEAGVVGARLETERAERSRRVAHRRDAITGVSEFPDVDETPPPARAAAAGSSTAEPRFAPLVARRYAELFEEQRERADRLTRDRGLRPAVYLATLGTQAVHAARSGFAQGLFGTAGIGVVSGPPAGFAGSGAAIACICSSDAVYAEEAEAAAAQLRGAGARRVYLAGRPAEAAAAAFTAAGVDEFVFAGADAVDITRRALDLLEVS